jgi:hypothetical protein
MTLPDHVRKQVKAILDHAARRILEERLKAEAEREVAA